MMKNALATLCLFCFFALNLSAQDKSLRPPAIGVSFLLNDFATAQRIRGGSLEAVLRDKKWAKFNEMSPGLAITYFRGLQKHVDFAGTLAASFLKYPFANKPAEGNDALLLEADASANFKLVSENYWFTPYLIAGIGASSYRNHFGAFIPLGMGLKLNIFDEASFFVGSQYRVPVTTDNSNYHFVYNIGVSGVIGNNKSK